MKATYITGIVAVAVVTTLAVFAADKTPASHTIVHLKSGGKTIAELRILGGSTLSLDSKKTLNVSGTDTASFKDLTLQFGGPSGKSITLQAEEAEILQSK